MYSAPFEATDLLTYSSLSNERKWKIPASLLLMTLMTSPTARVLRAVMALVDKRVCEGKSSSR